MTCGNEYIVLSLLALHCTDIANTNITILVTTTEVTYHTYYSHVQLSKLVLFPSTFQGDLDMIHLKMYDISIDI